MVWIFSDSVKPESWVTSIEAEKAERQYKELLENKDAMKEMKLFEMKDRVDTFLSKILCRSHKTQQKY